MKFRGHCTDGMVLEARLALPSDAVRPHLKLVVVCRLLGEEPPARQTEEGLSVVVFT